MIDDTPEGHPSAFISPAGGEPELIEPDDIKSALDALDPNALEEPEPVPSGSGLEDIEVVAHHPSEPWMIVRGRDNDDRLHAWITHAETREILWEPEGATHLIWLHSGEEIGLIGETYTPDPTKPAIIGSPLQSEFGYWFERWTWPERQRISHCPISMRTGWPTALLETPDPHLVFFEWHDQGEVGYEGILLDDGTGDRQDPNESYELGFPKIGDDLPIEFSADAQYLVRCHALPFTDQASGEWQRTLLFAYLTIIDRRSPTVRDVPVYRTLPPGWQVPDLPHHQSISEDRGEKRRIRSRWVQSCRFVDDAEVVLHLIDGTSERIGAKEPSLAALAPLPDRSPTSHTLPEVDQDTLWQIIAEDYRAQRLPTKHLRHPQEEVAIVQAEWPERKETEWMVGADGQVLWDPGDALAMVWVADGHEVALVRGAPYSFRTPIDQQLAFERRSWPELALLHRLDLSDWSGAIYDLVEIPHAEAVAMVWSTLGLHDPSPVTLRRLAFNRADSTAWLETQVPMHERSRIIAQSPSGRWLLCLRQQSIGWPSHEALFRWTRRSMAGIVTLYDWHQQQARDIALCEDFPANWAPPDLNERRSPLLPWYHDTPIAFIEEIAFVEEQHVQVRFATKRTLTMVLE